MLYRIVDDGPEWQVVPDNHNYGLDYLTAQGVAEHENNNSGGELFLKSGGQLRDDVVIEIRDRAITKSFTISADYSIDFFASETDSS